MTAPADIAVSDAPKGNWVDTRAPRAWRPYLRLMRADRPIGWQLLMLPGWTAIALAGEQHEQFVINTLLLAHAGRLSVALTG